MRVVFIAVAAVVAGTLAIAAVTASGSGGGASSSKVKVLSFQGGGSAATFIDNGASGGSPGDMIVVHEQLHIRGAAVGRVDTVCILTEPPRGRCEGTADIPGGQISTAGILISSTQPHTEGITGGTGRYRRARGTAKITPVATGRDDVRFTVFLK
jgi:hypothetical protein